MNPTLIRILYTNLFFIIKSKPEYIVEYINIHSNKTAYILDTQSNRFTLDTYSHLIDGEIIVSSLDELINVINEHDMYVNDIVIRRTSLGDI